MELRCEKILQGPILVPISTLAPAPLEVIRDFQVLLRPIDEGFVATLFDANISSSGETQSEAVDNIKDLIVMVFESLEHEDDNRLGPAMIRQKHALNSLMRRVKR